MKIRVSTIEDLPSISDMIKEMKCNPGIKYEIDKSYFTDSSCLFSVCEIDDKIIGFSLVKICTNEDFFNDVKLPDGTGEIIDSTDKIGKMHMLFVKKEYERIGVGTSLAKISKEWLVNNGINRVYSMAWCHKDGKTPSESANIRFGLKKICDIEDYWQEICPLEKCKCKAEVYFGEL